MKLHLPIKLRAALMACFVMITGASVPTAFADVKISAGGDDENPTLTATGAGGGNFLSASSIGGTDYTNDPKGPKLIFALDDDQSQSTYFSNSSFTILNDVQLGDGDDTKGFVMTNGFSSQTLTFAGTITGSGLFKQTPNQNGGLITCGYKFTGDMTGFSGTLTSPSANTITFGDGNAAVATSATKGVSGTGKIDGANLKLVYDYAANIDATPVYVANSSIIAGQITVQGEADMAFAKQITASTFRVTGDGDAILAGKASLGNVAGNGLIRIQNTTTATGNFTGGHVSLDGGTLDMDSHTLDSGAKINMCGEGTLKDAVVDGGTLYYSAMTGLISFNSVTWTAGYLDFAEELLDSFKEGDSVDLGFDAGSGSFIVAGWDESMYTIEGSTLTFLSFDVPMATVIWYSNNNGTLVKTQQDEIRILQVDDNTSLSYLDGSQATSGDITMNVRYSGETKIDVYGVAAPAHASSLANVNYVGNIKMDLSEGDFKVVVGGVANEWGSSIQNSTLTGDTLVQLSGTVTAEHLIGGNHKGAGVTLTGNTGVVVADNAVVYGMIVGGSTSAHNLNTTITGNTSVVITGVQHSAPANSHWTGGNHNLTTAQQNFIIGGSAHSSNSNSSTTVNGNTSVLVDLSDYTLNTEDAAKNNFVKPIVGGSFGFTGSHTVKGDSSVVINGKEGVTFTQAVVGGSLVQYNTAGAISNEGSTSVVINGNSVFDDIVGGSWNGSGSTDGNKVTVVGDVSVTLNGGVFKGDISGAGNLGTVGGSSTVKLNAAGTYGTDEAPITVAGTAGALVTGVKSLVLEGSFGDGLKNVNVAAFDKITNASDASILGLTNMTAAVVPSLTKEGAGALTVLSDSTVEGAVTINAGSLNLNGTGTSTLGSLTMAAGTSLTTAGSLTMGADLSLTLTNGEEDAIIEIGGSLTAGTFTTTLNGWENIDTSGEYVLISADNVSSSTFNWAQDGSELNGLTYSLVFDGDMLKLIVGAASGSWIWQEGTVWSDTSKGSEWGIPESADAAAGKALVFNSVGLGSATEATVNITGEVNPESITVTNGEGTAYNFVGAEGAAIKTGDLTKSGAGVLNLDVDMSGWTGNLIMKGGEVNLSTAMGEGSITVSGAATLGMGSDIERNTILEADLTINVGDADAENALVEATNSGVISGEGALTKTGDGTLTLSGANTFTGAVSISEGTVKAGNRKAFGNIANSVTVADGATLDTNDQLDLEYTVTIAGEGADGAGALINSGSCAEITGSNLNIVGLNLTDDATMGGSGWITLLGRNYAVVNVDLAGHTLTKTGSNTITFNNAAFTAGTVVVNEGTLRLQGNNANGTASVDMVVNNGKLDISPNGAILNTLNGAGGEVSLSDGNTPQGVRINNGGQYAGVISGAGCNVMQDGGTLTLTGDNTATGTWTIAEGATGVIGTDADDGKWAGNVGGAGDLILNNATDTIELAAGGTLSGTATLEGASAVKLGGADSLGTAAVTVNNGTLDMNGQAVANAVTITKGALSNAGSATSQVTVDAVAGTADAINTVELGGLSGANVASLTLGEYTRVTGVSGTLDMTGKTVSIKMDDGCVGVPGANLPAVVDAALTLDGATTTLDLSNQAVIDILTANKNEAVGVNLMLSGGQLTVENASQLTFSPLLSSLGYTVVGTSDGSGALNISGKTNLIYTVNDTENSDPMVINDYATLNPYAAVTVSNATLTVNLDGAPATPGNGLQLKNLVGANANLVVNNSGEAQAEIDLINDAATSFEGDISGDNVNFLKIGSESFTVEGNLTGAGSSLVVSGGEVVLNGDANSLEEIQLYTGNVTLGGASTTVETLSSASEGGTMTVESGAELTVTAQTGTLEKVTFSGEGAVNVDGGDMTLGDGSKLDGVSVTVAEGASLASTDAAAIHTVSGLNGAGSVDLGGSTMNVTGKSVFTGDLNGSGTMNISSDTTLVGAGNADYALNVEGGALTLKGVPADSVAGTADTAYKGIAVIDGTLSIGDQDVPNTCVQLGEDGLSIAGDSTVNITIDAAKVGDIPSPIVNSKGNVVIGDGTGTVTINTINLSNIDAAASDELELVLFSSTDGSATLGDYVLNDQVLNTIYKELNLKVNDAGNAIVMTGVASTDNQFATLATTPNSEAAADLLWDARYVAAAGDSQLRNLYTAVSAQKNTDPAAAQHAMTASAGSTVTSLVISQRDALRDQMGWIRNRVANMGVNPNYTNEDMPYFHMWMQATGSTASLDTDGDESGYDLNTWGGTFGVDVDLSDSFTAGLAFTASYGDLSATAADTAEGDVDSYYLNLFARYQSKQWSHLFVMTAGWSDASLTRTVNYGTGSYQGEGDSSGFAFGLMYELAYDIALNEDKSAILQPLFNVSMVSANMNGYNESGTAGNAGLKVGDMDMVTGTVAVGARLTGLVGSNIFGREALGEVRVNIAQDFGDRQGEARVGYLGSTGMSTIYGAEEGRTAIQIGAGLSVPVGYNGVIYVDGNADLRSGSTSLNGSIGYRYDF